MELTHLIERLHPRFLDVLRTELNRLGVRDINGDQVIKSLSHLLRQRLRRIDVSGRMGGEEFAAVLAGTSIEKTKKIFDGIR